MIIVLVLFYTQIACTLTMVIGYFVFFCGLHCNISNVLNKVAVKLSFPTCVCIHRSTYFGTAFFCGKCAKFPFLKKVECWLCWNV